MNFLRPIAQRLSRVSRRSTLCTSTQRWFSGSRDLAVELMTPRCLPDPQARLRGVARVGGQALVQTIVSVVQKRYLRISKRLIRPSSIWKTWPAFSSNNTFPLQIARGHMNLDIGCSILADRKADWLRA